MNQTEMTVNMRRVLVDWLVEVNIFNERSFKIQTMVLGSRKFSIGSRNSLSFRGHY